jgi:hypothetical protein
LFCRSHRREPASFEESTSCTRTGTRIRPETIDPFDVLTREQIDAASAQFKSELRPTGGA